MTNRYYFLFYSLLLAFSLSGCFSPCYKMRSGVLICDENFKGKQTDKSVEKLGKDKPPATKDMLY